MGSKDLDVKHWHRKQTVVQTWQAHMWKKPPLKNSECGKDILGREARYGKATRGRRNTGRKHL